MRILVIRLSSIGDIVLTTSALRCLRNTFPDAHIAFLTKPQFVPVIKPNPNINEVIALPTSFNILIKLLKNSQFTHVIDLHKNMRTLKIRFFLNTKWITFKKNTLLKWALVNFKVKQKKSIDLHITQRYFNALKPLGVVNDIQGLDFYTVNPILPMQISELLPNTYIVYAIGGTYATKRLPIATLEKWLFTQSKTSFIVLIGGQLEKQNTKHIELPNVLNLCGNLSIEESALVVKNATLVISHDSAFMHIANAFAKPLLAIWGNTVPDFGFYPIPKLNEKQVALENKVNCRPCSKLGFNKCPKGHFNCMAYSSNQITLKINELLQSSIN